MTNAIVIYKGKAKPNSWARWMVNRTKRQNKNNLISVVGPTGSGKTYSAISICEIMSKMDGVPFTINHIVFSLRELMSLINSGELVKSSKIVCDEFQCSIGARDFQSEANKVFNFLLSTFRHRNLTLFFCTPFETLLDKNTRKLFHAKFETLSINQQDKTCRLKPRFVEYSDFKAEPYRKQLIVVHKGEDGRTRGDKLFYWDVPKPDDELVKQYEQKKLEFTNNLNKNISDKLDQYDAKGKSITTENKADVKVDWDRRKPLTPTQERTMRVVANIKESNRLEVASKILGVSISAVHKAKEKAEERGYRLEEFRKDDS